MKIVVLDGFILNPGDLSWEPLNRFGEVEIYERTSPEEIMDRASDANMLLTNKTPLPEEVLSRLPGLKYIGVLATGYDVVDVKSANERNITVTNIPDYGTQSVAQHVFALILELCHHVQRHSDSVRNFHWSESKDWSYWNYPLYELSGKTMGIIGFGRIGRQVASIGAAFGMQIVTYSRTKPEDMQQGHTRWVTLEELFVISDIISLHCPLTEKTERMINHETISLMKPNAWLINTSRGKLVHEKHLTEALNEGRLAAAALDVLSTEPPDFGNPLLSAKNCLITPHLAWATREARSRLLNTGIENICAYLSGKPINVVNKQ